MLSRFAPVVARRAPFGPTSQIFAPSSPAAATFLQSNAFFSRGFATEKKEAEGEKAASSGGGESSDGGSSSGGRKRFFSKERLIKLTFISALAYGTVWVYEQNKEVVDGYFSKVEAPKVVKKQSVYKGSLKDVAKDIKELIEDPEYDDGSRGPLFVRLAWHCAGTYDKNTDTGGSNGATMRFREESNHGANAGLYLARAILEPVKKRHPWISYADLYTLAGIVAIYEMGGPAIRFRSGRTDATDRAAVPPDGRLPDASQGAKHIRDVFYRMGFDDQEIVALVGAHCLGRCHRDRSGFDGPWTRAPTSFSNEFFRELLESKWTKRKWNGPEQYEDQTKELMMLPADLALVQDPKFKAHVVAYAKDQDLFFNDFAKAFGKLLELGVKFDEESTEVYHPHPF